MSKLTVLFFVTAAAATFIQPASSYGNYQLGSDYPQWYNPYRTDHASLKRQIVFPEESQRNGRFNNFRGQFQSGDENDDNGNWNIGQNGWNNRRNGLNNRRNGWNNGQNGWNNGHSGWNNGQSGWDHGQNGWNNGQNGWNNGQDTPEFNNNRPNGNVRPVSEDVEEEYIFDRPTTPRPGSGIQLAAAPVAPSGNRAPGVSPDTQFPRVALSVTTQCELNCHRNTVTNEYNPVCGSDRITYTNPGKMRCANECGKNVQVGFNGSCGRPANTI